MSNAVWVYFRPGFNQPQSVEEFLAWTDRHDVKVVLLHLEGKKYRNFKLVEPQMQEFIQGCVEHKLEVHGLFNALTSVPEEWISDEYRDLFCVDYHGISILDEPISGRRFFLDPNKSEVVELLKQISHNILQSYPELSGIQLDFIRYYNWQSTFTINARQMGHNVSFLKQGTPLKLAANGGEVSYFLQEAAVLYDDPPFGDEFAFYRNFSYCFCNHCLEGFFRDNGITIPENQGHTAEIAQWILDHYAERWYEYRSAILESVVRQVHQTVKAVDASKQLSITVWYNSPYGNELIDKPMDPASVVRDFGQNWWDWVDSGLIDFICPMNYWLKPESFAQVIQEQVSKMKQTIPLYSGLLRSNEFEISPSELEEYQAVSKIAGAEGICFFHYGTWKD
ncbi:MAG: family 10 glycosylhydrolase [Firmicutes bacterium]|nr:family 10 glycosylhydrolase [Bacillota bacterium]